MSWEKSIVVVMVLLMACAPDPVEVLTPVINQKIQIGEYELTIPITFTHESEYGFDSEIGKIKGIGIEITYDYGQYGGPFRGITEDRFQILKDTTDTIFRDIIISKDPMVDFTALYIQENFGDSDILGLSYSLKAQSDSLTLREQKYVVDIFKSAKKMP